MAIIGIVAVDRAGAIGKGGRLPWHYSADLKHFKEQTTGHAVVMGRKTWLTLRKPLPNRLNVVLSRSAAADARREASDSPTPVVWLSDAPSALALTDYLKCDLYVIGGAQVFEAFRPHIQRWVVTQIPLTVEGADTFMPQDFLEGFRPSDSRQLEEDLKVTFYERVSG